MFTTNSPMLIGFNLRRLAINGSMKLWVAPESTEQRTSFLLILTTSRMELTLEIILCNPYGYRHRSLLHIIKAPILILLHHYSNDFNIGKFFYSCSVVPQYSSHCNGNITHFSSVHKSRGLWMGVKLAGPWEWNLLVHNCSLSYWLDCWRWSCLPTIPCYRSKDSSKSST